MPLLIYDSTKAARDSSLLLGRYRVKVADKWGLLKFLVLSIVFSAVAFTVIGMALLSFDNPTDKELMLKESQITE
jgi:hypothetical protein